jgi:hypothetical protein
LEKAAANDDVLQRSLEYLKSVGEVRWGAVEVANRRGRNRR